MKSVRAAALAVLLGISVAPAVAENKAITLPLNDASVVWPHNVTVKTVHHNGSDALEVRLSGPYRGLDTDTFAFVPGLDFHDGTIEVDVAGSVLPDAPADARGFVGVAFRIDAEGCTSNAGRPFEVTLDGKASNNQKLLRAKAVMVNVLVKRRGAHVMYG